MKTPHAWAVVAEHPQVPTDRVHDGMTKDRGGHRRIRSLLALATLACAATLVLAGCGASPTTSNAGSSAPATSTQAVSTTTAMQQQFVQVVKQVGPSVVLVESNKGLGSGIVVNAQGYIVSNNHVVAGSSNFQVVLADGKKYAAKVVGTFPPDDLAVLHINASGLIPAAFADSSKLSVGDLTLALGNPLGLQSSVTEGIVSALGRTVDEGNGVALPNAIQTSAAINPGNSGGALVNLSGQVIGIPTLTATDPQLGGGQAPGIGFAIPSNTVRDIATQIISQGKVTDSHRAYLGVETGTTTSGGALVTQVAPGGPAARSGIQAGELITAVDGTPTPDSAALADALAALKPGQTITVAVLRPDAGNQTLRVTLGQYPG
jgi:S1-C subfamily serine protease